VGQVLVAHAVLVEGSWAVTKYSVENVGPSQPATRVRGSKIVKMKRGIGGRIEAMAVLVMELVKITRLIGSWTLYGSSELREWHDINQDSS